MEFLYLENIYPFKPFRFYKVIEPMVVGKAHLRPGAEISYDPNRNEFVLKGTLEYNPWESPDGPPE